MSLLSTADRVIGECFTFQPAFTPFPLPVNEVRVPQVYLDIGKPNSSGPVCEVPCAMNQRGIKSDEHYCFYQIYHRNPLVPLRYYPMTPGVTVLRMELEKIIVSMEGRKGIKPKPNPVALPFRYLVLHEDEIPSERIQVLREYLESSFDMVRVYPEDGIRLYATRIHKPDETMNSDESSNFQTKFYRMRNLPKY